MGMVILAIGIIIALAGAIWLAVTAFQESVLWGVGCLFCGPVALIFTIMHWQEAKKPFLTYLVGAILAAVGSAMKGN
jgi:hypothetical protein